MQQITTGKLGKLIVMKSYISLSESRWATTNVIEEPVKVSHDALIKWMKYYEPFYISSDAIPPFEERFLGYGFTRSSQVIFNRYFKNMNNYRKSI
jgi:hypothetical protein